MEDNNYYLQLICCKFRLHDEEDDDVGLEDGGFEVEDGYDNPSIVVFSDDADSYADVPSFILPPTHNSIQHLIISNTHHLVHHQDASLASLSCCDQLLDNDFFQTEAHQWWVALQCKLEHSE